MMRHRGWLAIAGVLCLLLCGAPAMAGDTPAQGNRTPESLRGIWSSPDCTRADKMYVITEHAVMKAWPERYYIGRSKSFRSEAFESDRLIHLVAEGYSVIIKQTNDGLIHVIEGDVHPQQILSTSWGSQQDFLSVEYSRCEKLFDTSMTLGQEEVNIPFLIDRIIAACPATTAERFGGDVGCHAALFTLLDRNGDALLNADELAALYRYVTFAVSATVQLCDQFNVYTPRTRDDAATFARNVLNGKTGLSLDAVRAALALKPGPDSPWHVIAENARNLQSLIPFAPASESSRACTRAITPATSGLISPAE